MDPAVRSRKFSRRAFARAAAALPAVAGERPVPADSSLVSFGVPWTSPFRVDAQFPHQLVNREGEHVFVLNKTAWAYFGCKDPHGVVERARDQGVTVLRVVLEGTPYFDQLGIDCWPWEGTRQRPDWTAFNEEYWNRVEERIRIAGDAGIGFDLCLYFTLHPEAGDIDRQRPYWEYTLRRLSRYANVLTWEIANEYVRNPEFQDAAGTYFKKNDSWGRPVCSSDGTTDDAVWPHKPWMDLAVVHTCTSSTPSHPLKEWYQSVARNVRSHGKPAFNNESGRENRHRNDDPVHRRKQGWIWCASASFWTWHSWEGCEGIDDADYRGPGAEYLRPMSDFFRSIAFWRLNPNYTALSSGSAPVIHTAAASAARDLVVGYLCTPQSGAKAPPVEMAVRLPNGSYRAEFLNPADLSTVGETRLETRNVGTVQKLETPGFTDDLLVKIENVRAGEHLAIPGTR